MFAGRRGDACDPGACVLHLGPVDGSAAAGLPPAHCRAGGGYSGSIKGQRLPGCGADRQWQDRRVPHPGLDTRRQPQGKRPVDHLPSNTKRPVEATACEGSADGAFSGHSVPYPVRHCGMHASRMAMAS